MIDILLTRYSYVGAVVLIASGLYLVGTNPNLIKKIIGLNIFQTGIFLFLISTSYVEGGSSPVIESGAEGLHVSPLPHVLILTAIVVGMSLTAVGLTLVVRIYTEYGTLNEERLRRIER